jgi:hypothetical protein
MESIPMLFWIANFSDWGEYANGNEISAAEVQGVLLLSDVYRLLDDVRALAERLPLNVNSRLVPDLSFVVNHGRENSYDAGRE